MNRIPLICVVLFFLPICFCHRNSNSFSSCRVITRMRGITGAERLLFSSFVFGQPDDVGGYTASRFEFKIFKSISIFSIIHFLVTTWCLRNAQLFQKDMVLKFFGFLRILLFFLDIVHFILIN